MEGGPCVGDLPGDVLSHIFSFLKTNKKPSIPDLLSVALVNRTWHSAARSSPILVRVDSTSCVQKIRKVTSSFKYVHVKVTEMTSKALLHFFSVIRAAVGVRIHLDMREIELGVEGGKLLGALLSDSSCIVDLNINDTGLNCEGAKHIFESLKTNKSVKALYIDDNKIGDDSLVVLAEALARSPSLSTITCNFNHISEKGIEYLCTGLERTRSLRILCLNGNCFGDNGMKTLCQSLKINRSITNLHVMRVLQCNRLKTLNVGDNFLGSSGAHAVGKSLMMNSCLEVLNMYDNHISGDGIKRVAEHLTKNSALKVLYLCKNRIDDAGATDLARALPHNRTLTELVLTLNSVGNVGASKLAEALDLSGLRVLDIRANSLDWETLTKSNSSTLNKYKYADPPLCGQEEL